MLIYAWPLMCEQIYVVLVLWLKGMYMTRAQFFHLFMWSIRFNEIMTIVIHMVIALMGQGLAAWISYLPVCLFMYAASELETWVDWTLPRMA